MLKRLVTLASFGLFLLPCLHANELAESQQGWYERYKDQDNAPKPQEQLLNTDPEPDLSQGFVALFNGKDFTGWNALDNYEVIDGAIVGTCIPGSPSTYLSTERDDYTDFIFTAEVKWEVPGNTGIQFRSVNKDNKTVGPQFELEEDGKNRGWSGGIYGQSCGGYFYPLWLEEHEAARNAVDYDGWNRVTIKAEGDTIKTWINGVPASHAVIDAFPEGFFALQVHSGKQGKIHFRNIKVKELGGTKP